MITEREALKNRCVENSSDVRLVHAIFVAMQWNYLKRVRIDHKIVIQKLAYNLHNKENKKKYLLRNVKNALIV